jgi:ureidoacrylate peracid hydrolase
MRWKKEFSRQPDAPAGTIWTGRRGPGDVMSEGITIEAKPEPIRIDIRKTAVLVVDMQNAFIKEGGYADLAGYDISRTDKIVGPCQEIIRAGRDKGAKIIYFQMGCSPDLSDMGPDDSPGAYKSKGRNLIKQRPDLREKLYVYGGWGAEIIEELEPQKGDLVIRKQRYDGFIGTNLDIVLRTFGLKYLLFAGTATNICVESTIRHAFFLDFFPILISDAVCQMGPDLLQEATIMNVQSTFGWVADSKSVLRAMNHISK